MYFQSEDLCLLSILENYYFLWFQIFFLLHCFFLNYSFITSPLSLNITSATLIIRNKSFTFFPKLVSLMLTFFSFSQIQSVNNPVGSNLKINPESDHFSPLSLSPPYPKPPLAFCFSFVPHSLVLALKILNCISTPGFLLVLSIFSPWSLHN